METCLWDTRPCPKTVFMFIGMESGGMNVFVNTLCPPQQNKLSHNYPCQDCHTLCRFRCMSCLYSCLPVCCRRQEFDHPFVEDPEREDNFVPVDTRPPLVIYLDNTYTRLIVAWGDIWDHPN